MLGEWVAHASRYGANASGLMVRRTRTELVDTIERSKQLFRPLNATFHESDKLWRFPNEARLRFAYLERDADAEAYQGHSYTRVYVEEIGNFPDPAPVLKLMATLRSGAGVPCRFRATGNPGGPGHHWVRARYIDPAPMGFKVIAETFRNPWTNEDVTRERVFIPARVSDNPTVGGDYVANLQMQGSPELVRAWLEGDWSVIAGAFFPEFSLERHVIKPRELPAHWTRYRAMDWGSAAPFAVLWFAVSDGELAEFPRGALVVYREWYGAQGPNKGIGMVAEEVARGVVRRDGNDVLTDSLCVLDPAAFADDGGPSIAERMFAVGAKFRPADNKRIGRVGAMGGWDQLRARLRGDGERPALYLFDTCVHTIRTLPALQHDTARPEDVDTDGEDHAPDALRYGCMARPYATDRPVTDAQRQAAGIAALLRPPTLDELWQDNARRNEERI